MDPKKLEILEKATGVFLKYGIKSVTMDDMAYELGISKKTLYVHFKDKSDLVEQIIAAKTAFDRQQCEVVLHESENAIDEMLRVSKWVAEMMQNIHPSVFYDLRKFHSKAWQLLHDHKWKFVKGTIQQNIVRGKAEGLYRDDLNNDIVATIYIASTDLISDGESFVQYNFTSNEAFQEIILFFLFGLVNEKGLIYLQEKLAL